MLQIHSTYRLDQIEYRLRAAVERHGGSILSVNLAGAAVVYSVCFNELYTPLLHADVRFSAFLPSRIAAFAQGECVFLETVSPREYCRLLHLPEFELLALALEDTLRQVMEEAARHMPAQPAALAHAATEEQVNMRAALPQRIDCHGTKVEELAGVGSHDSQGG
jgi:hypothetical protein